MSSDDVSALTAALTRSTAAMREALSGLDVASLSRRPAPDEWSVWDIAYHIAQIEVWYAAKLCEAVSDDAAESMERFLSLWSELRAGSLALAAQIPPARLDVDGLLMGVPDWTPRQLVARMTAHDHEHAAQARAARHTDGGGGRTSDDDGDEG